MFLSCLCAQLKARCCVSVSARGDTATISLPGKPPTPRHWLNFRWIASCALAYSCLLETTFTTLMHDNRYTYYYSKRNRWHGTSSLCNKFVLVIASENRKSFDGDLAWWIELLWWRGGMKSRRLRSVRDERERVEKQNEGNFSLKLRSLALKCLRVSYSALLLSGRRRVTATRIRKIPRRISGRNVMISLVVMPSFALLVTYYGAGQAGACRRRVDGLTSSVLSYSRLYERRQQPPGAVAYILWEYNIKTEGSIRSACIRIIRTRAFRRGALSSSVQIVLDFQSTTLPPAQEQTRWSKASSWCACLSLSLSLLL